MNKLISLAKNAMEQKKYNEALEIYREIREKVPDSWEGYGLAAWILAEIGKYDEADNLCCIGMDKFPKNSDLFCVYAISATRRKDFITALKRWANVRKKFPYNWRGYARGALPLFYLSRYEEAEKLCTDGMAILPNEPEIFEIYAYIALWIKDWTKALKRFKLCIKKFPQRPQGYIGTSEAYYNLLNYEKAEKILKIGMKSMPDNPDCFIKFAELAMSILDYEEAIKRFFYVRQKFPNELRAYQGEAKAHFKIGEHLWTKAMYKR